MEVAIVGAGPAGSTLAALLAGRGIAVAVYDRDRFPRDKLCGEFLSYDALPLLDALGVTAAIDRAGAPRIAKCRIVARHTTYTFSFPHEAIGVSRLVLDDLLLRKAEEKGATRRDGETVTDVESLGGRVTAGAWGRWGRFDQQLGRRFTRDRSRRNYGFKRHYRGDRAADTIDLHPFRHGYLGVNAVEGGVTNICGLVHASRLSGHRGRWEGFVDQLRGEEPTLDHLFGRHVPAQEAFLSSEPVIFRARDPVERGIFMVGDASGIIDPLTGNGMAMAIQSALIAAPFIVRLLEQPRRRREIEEAYRRAHHAFFGARIRWSRVAAAVLSRPRLVDRVARRASSLALGELFLRRTRASRDEVSRLVDAWFC